jgi:predicted transcriptional regulator
VVEEQSDSSHAYRLSDEERAAVRRGLDEARQGKFATDDEVKAVFDRYRQK